MASKTPNEKDPLDKNTENVTVTGSKAEKGEGKMMNYTDDESREMTKRDKKDSLDKNVENVSLAESITKKIGKLKISGEGQGEGQGQDEGRGQGEGQREGQGQGQQMTTQSDSSILLITSNTGPPFGKSPQADHRKEGIVGLLNKETPDIVFFQDFPWVDLQTPGKHMSITGDYAYSGWRNTSIVYKRNRFTIESQNEIDMEDEELERYLKELTNNERLHMLKITTTSSLASFLCVSWYGKKAIASLQLDRMLKIVKETARLNRLPFIIAGDFNVSIDIVKTEINLLGMRIYDYEPHSQREGKQNIDFFISSENLSLTDVQSINWGDLPEGVGVKTIFDHDPVRATLSL